MEFYTDSYMENSFIHISPEMPPVHFLRRYLFFSKSNRTEENFTKIGLWVNVHISYPWFRFGSDRPRIRALCIKNIGVILQ